MTARSCPPPWITSCTSKAAPLRRTRPATPTLSRKRAEAPAGTCNGRFEQQQRTIAHEKDYIARNIAGQNSKQAKGRRKRLERLPRLGPVIGADGTMALRFESRTGRRSGSDRTERECGDRARTLVERFSGTLERTGRGGNHRTQRGGEVHAAPRAPRRASAPAASSGSGARPSRPATTAGSFTGAARWHALRGDRRLRRNGSAG